MRSYIQAKAMARSLRGSLAARNVSLSHSDCLEIVARQFGFRDWNVLASKIALDTGTRDTPPAASDVAFQPAIPVVRVLSAASATEFYARYLGFTFDWGDGESERPMYAQVSRSGVTLHLSEHEGGGSPGGEILVRMTGLNALRRELTRPDLPQPRLLETGDDRRELQVTDPFGNTLRFSENNPAGVANVL